MKYDLNWRRAYGTSKANLGLYLSICLQRWPPYLIFTWGGGGGGV